MSTDPLDRLRQACLAAIERCAAKESEGIDPNTFAELGESLFWLCALAEATAIYPLHGTRGRTFRSRYRFHRLAWIADARAQRNAVAHSRSSNRPNLIDTAA